jgi:hypothetical protein
VTEHLASEPIITDRQERQLLKALSAAIRSELRNPDRRGCPTVAAVRQLARRGLSVDDTGDLVDHVATCAHCFEAYMQYRRRRRIARVGGPVVAFVTALIGLAVFWHLWAPINSTRHPQTAHFPIPPILKASIDYREGSPTRSPDVPAGAARTPRLQMELLDLTILLPFGTEDGQYAIEIRSSSGKTMMKASGAMQWNGTAEAVTVKLDLRQLSPGDYTIALRSGDASWRAYPLILEHAK